MPGLAALRSLRSVLVSDLLVAGYWLSVACYWFLVSFSAILILTHGTIAPGTLYLKEYLNCTFDHTLRKKQAVSVSVRW
jgi:hypothetical protein